MMARSMSVLVAALLLGILTAVRGGEAPPADEQAIRATWSELDAAWAARDVERISRLFADDAMFAFLPGERQLDGGAEVRAHFAAQFPRQSPALRHVTEIRRVRPLGDGLSVVDAAVRVLRGEDDTEPGALLRAFAVFAVMQRREDEWKIVEIRAYQLPGSGDG